MPIWYKEILVLTRLEQTSNLNWRLQTLKKETGRKFTMDIKLVSMMEHNHDVHWTREDYFDQILTMGMDIVAGTFAEKSISGSRW